MIKAQVDFLQSFQWIGSQSEKNGQYYSRRIASGFCLVIRQFKSDFTSRMADESSAIRHTAVLRLSLGLRERKIWSTLQDILAHFFRKFWSLSKSTFHG